QLCPGSGIEIRGLEHRNEVLVSELVLRAVRCNVVFVFVGTLAVHVSGVPLISEGWHRIDAPMDKDAELRVPVPFGGLIFLERFPIRTKRAVMVRSVHLFEQRGALAVVFATGLLPDCVDRFRVVRSGWSGGALGLRSRRCQKREQKSTKYNRQQPTMGKHDSSLLQLE